MSTILLVDVSFLSWRAFFTTGQLTHQGEPTGVAFGVLRALEDMTDLFGATQCVLAFDAGGGGHRVQLLPSYKANRRDQVRTEAEELALENFYIQLVRMRTKLFPALGFSNIFQAKGYEADDIIAYCAERVESKDEAIIITGDDDLWQCLTSNVKWYSPTQKQLMTHVSFKEEYYGLDPCQWADVKALAGCKGDNVEGVEGVGNITAAKWFRNQLKPDSKAYQNILSNLDVHKRNVSLVRLPFPGLVLPELKPDDRSAEKMMRVQQELGIRDRRRPRPGVVKSAVRGFDV